MRFHHLSHYRWLIGSVLCLVVALSGCASGGSVANSRAGARDTVSEAQLGAPDSWAKPGATGNAADYRVGAQDLLEISVFQVKDLDRTVRVNTGGDISLPLVGIIHAGGRTVQEVEDDIAGKLTSKFLQNPQVSVFVKEFTSQRVTLEGALRKPGIYPLTGQTSLLQAIALAEGLSEMADLQGVIIFRVIEGKKKAAKFDLKQIRKGNAEDPAIYGDDIVVVEQSGSKSIFSKIVQSMPALGVFTLF